MSQLSIVLRTQSSGAALVDEVEMLLAEAERQGMAALRYLHTEAVEAGVVVHVWQGTLQSESLKIVEDEAMNGKYALATGQAAKKLLQVVGSGLGMWKSTELRDHIKSRMEQYPDSLMLIAFDGKSASVEATRRFLSDVIAAGTDKQIAAAISAICLMRDQSFISVLDSLNTTNMSDEVRNAVSYAIAILKPQ